jgi:iron complex transport system substrate-binding protein
MNRICFVLPALLLACSGGDSSDKRVEQSIVRTIRPDYAQGFSIDVLADSTKRIVLFNLEAPGETLQVIHWKPRSVKSIGCLSTTHIPFLRALNRLDVLKGAGFADRMKDSVIISAVQAGQIRNLTAGNELDPEAVFAVQPDLLFVYPFGGAGYEKFLQRGIGCVQVSEYLEKHPLGRAEWIKVFGILLQREEEADSTFESIEKQYRLIREANQNANSGKTMFLASMDGDRWAVSPANSFIAQLVNDAGAKYHFLDSISTGNLLLSFESFYMAANKADFWGKIIYSEVPPSIETFTENDVRLLSLSPVKNDQLFYCNALRDDYHGQALLEPQVLLKDLTAILNDSSEATYPYRYFRPLRALSSAEEN